MKKIIALGSVLGLLITFHFVSASSASVLTSSIPNPIVSQYYSTRITFFSDATFGTVNVTASYLPLGINLVNGTPLQSGVTNPNSSIFGLTQKDSSGNYYIDLAGTPTVPGASNISIQIYDPVHSFDVTQNYSVTITAFAVDQLPPHLDGTNVLGNDGTVYFLQNSTRHPYTSAGAFLSYGFNNWQGVVFASNTDMALSMGNFVPPRDGSLINDHGTIYLIAGGLRYGFTTMQAFKVLGYSLSNVTAGDTSFMQSGFPPIDGTDLLHKAGTLLNDNGTVYLVINSQLYGFPSMATFNGWGYTLKQVININSTDRILLKVNGGIRDRAAGDLNP